MIIIETEKLLLRTLEPSDLDALMDIWGNDEVMKYCGGAGTREQELRSLQYYINMQKERGFSPYLVLHKDTLEILGENNSDYNITIVYINIFNYFNI